jgi:hypothetical protein
MRVAGAENIAEFYRLRDDVPFSEVWRTYAHQVLTARQQYPDT